MKRLIAALLVVLLPAMVLAQPVTVQTGEHASFSRVVVRLPAGSDWRFGRDANGYVLRMPGADGYDLRRFFDLIPATRITAVSQDEGSGTLRLAVSCPCRADVAVLDARFLVIDIADGGPDPNSEFERPIDGETVAPPAGMTGPGLFPVVFPRSPDAGLRTPAAVSLFPSPAPRQPLAPAVTEELDALERLVVESLGRGLTAGFLEPDMSAPQAAPRQLPQIARDLPLPGITVSDGVDPAALTDVDKPVVAADGTACVPDTFVGVTSWADDRPFVDQIGASRSVLVEEFDRLSPDRVLALARLYVHFGFGREAIQTLDLDGVGSAERSTLRMLAQVIDDDPVDFIDASRQLTCTSDIALWAFLAIPPDQLGDGGDRAAILRAFKNLPPPLQSHLGPRLAERFAMIGDDDAADQALRMARRDAADTIETQLAAATLATRLGDDTAALTTLTTLARTEARITPEATIRFLTESARNGAAVTHDDMVIVDALRFEHAMTPVAADLAAAQIAAYLGMDDFENAARLLRDERNSLGPTRADAVQAEFDRAAVARMPDAEFLAYIFARDFPEPDPDLRLSLASRLITLGFPDQALRHLGTPEAGASDDDLHLRAEAWLQLRDPDAAIRALGNLQTDRADRLRAAARSQLAGDPAATPDAPDDTVTDWRHGNWTDLAQSEDPLMRDAVAAMLNSDNPVFDERAPLASGRSLLENAAASRVMLDCLLERFVPPEDF